MYFTQGLGVVVALLFLATFIQAGVFVNELSWWIWVSMTIVGACAGYLLMWIIFHGAILSRVNINVPDGHRLAVVPNNAPPPAAPATAAAQVLPVHL